MEELINQEIAKITKKYKINPGDAKTLFLDTLNKSQPLDLSDPNVQKTKKYKELLKNVKKAIYYKLRQYKPVAQDFDELLSTLNKDNSVEVFKQICNQHISTKERQNQLDGFLDQLEPYIKSSTNIIDIGGGVFPLQFDFSKTPLLRTYTWIDKDKVSAKAVEEFAKYAPVSVIAHADKIGEKPWTYYLPEIKYFDFAIMLKVVPVIARQEKVLLHYLTEVPAKRIFVSASKTAMTKNEKIYGRENKVLMDFIKKSGKTPIQKIEIDTEFGYILE